MPWMPRRSLDRWDQDLRDYREKVLALLRELGEARAETERWRGQAEAQAAQVARMETDLETARKQMQDAQRKGEDEDPWAHDEKEYQRILREAETAGGLVRALVTEGGTVGGRAGTNMSG